MKRNKLISNYMLFTEGGTECQILGIAAVIVFLPSIFTEDSKLKIIRFIGLVFYIPNIIIFLPILIPLLIAGAIQKIYQEC